MFTGIITDVGRVETAEQRADLRLTISCAYDMESVDLGASISCSGVCLTVVDKTPRQFSVDVSRETISRTAAGMWTEGARLNLERALKVGDELGGHIVTGHVDGIGIVESATDVGGSIELVIRAGAEVAPYIAEKGSIALDGVSLTVNRVESQGDEVRFWINIIPHTAEKTNFADVRSGRELNIEIDILARYLGRMMELRR